MKNPAVAVLVIALTPIVLLILVFAGTEANKAYWDWQVRKLCEEEGGVTVYETVALSKDEFVSLGGTPGKPLTVPFKGAGVANDDAKSPYEVEMEKIEINRSNPQVWRNKFSIYRKSDKKILGKYITFTRRDGDFPVGIGHPSNFSCRDIKGFYTGFEGRIFNVKGQ